VDKFVEFFGEACREGPKFFPCQLLFFPDRRLNSFYFNWNMIRSQ
jgi:hypothetical protein